LTGVCRRVIRQRVESLSNSFHKEELPLSFGMIFVKRKFATILSKFRIIAFRLDIQGS